MKEKNAKKVNSVNYTEIFQFASTKLEKYTFPVIYCDRNHRFHRIDPSQTRFSKIWPDSARHN